MALTGGLRVRGQAGGRAGDLRSPISALAKPAIRVLERATAGDVDRHRPLASAPPTALRRASYLDHGDDAGDVDRHRPRCARVLHLDEGRGRRPRPLPISGWCSEALLTIAAALRSARDR